jgi:hypothetical protein
MSYDISIYVRSFLKRAVETSLGDWTVADPIPRPAVDALIRLAFEAGFRKIDPDPGFVEFLRQKGKTPAEEYLLDTPQALATLQIFRGELVFTIPYSGRATNAIELCTSLARRISEQYELGFHDPQVGTSDY